MSDLRQNVVSGTQPTGHAQISAEGHFPFEISDEQLPGSQPEGLGFSQSSEGLQNPLTTDLESRQSELSEYVSGNNQRPKLAKRQRPQDRGQETNTASGGTVTDDPAGEDPEAITPPTSLSGISPGLDLLSHSQEQQGNATTTRAAPNMSRAKRLTSLGTAVEGGRQPPGNHNMQVLRKENEGKGRGQPEIPSSNIQVTEGRGNAMATSDMGRAKRLIALSTTVEGGRQPSGKHDMQVLQKENEGNGRGQPEIPPNNIHVTVGRGSVAMQGHSQSSTEMVSPTTLGGLRFGPARTKDK